MLQCTVVVQFSEQLQESVHSNAQKLALQQHKLHQVGVV